jgi:hypothetical protein
LKKIFALVHCHYLNGLIIVDGVSSKGSSGREQRIKTSRLSEQLELDELWESLSQCLLALAKMPDNHAVLVLQPAVEAFFLVHAGQSKHTLFHCVLKIVLHRRIVSGSCIIKMYN